jgi:hypothetical protein
MKTTISEHDFVKAFDDFNRSENFSREGRRALYNYLIEMEEDCETELELDVIGICCDFTESSVTEALDNYSLESLDELKENTIVIEIDDESIIYQSY